MQLTTSLNEVQEFVKTIESDNKAKDMRDFINEEMLPPLIAKQRVSLQVLCLKIP